MTIAELMRLIDSKKRIEKRQDQKRANFDYALAGLISRSVSRIYSSSATMPDISEVYPNLFDSEQISEQRQTQKNEMSIIRFKQFAQNYNKNYKTKEVQK